MAKAIPEHKDILGQELKEGSYVAVAYNGLCICLIKRITPKMVRVFPVGNPKHKGWYVYPTDMILISGPDATAYILKNI